MYKMLLGICERKRPLGISEHGWEDNIKMDLREIEWIHVAQARVKWWAFVKRIMNLLVPYNKAGIFFGS